jgi:S1-C subfamily serine protease
MMRVLQYLLVVCVISTVTISSTAYARLAKITENLNATVLVIGKKDGDVVTKDKIAVGMGSGVVISDEGHFVTNYHVIEDATSVVVLVYDEDDKNEYATEIIGIDAVMDIAVLKIVSEKMPKFNRVTWGDNPLPGDDVYTIGHPQGMVWTVAKGVVGHEKRYATSPWQRLIQSDSLIMPGNSGGPMFDEKGNLIGINTLLVPSKDDMNTQAWSMSVHVEDVMWAVQRIFAYGDVRRPAMNITVEYDNGLFITPNENSELSKSGLRKKVKLLRADNLNILTYEHLYSVLKNHKDGDRLVIAVEEDGQEKEYSFNLESWSVLDKLDADKKKSETD